ncbi:unnamed protein product [Owenia fusiformis]|uniref:Uncharacterized protein n=1 Tax=Owenia fusiformis TaxID=6347 RepID=A0A8S4PYQ8_OWEFU|nr:unnamed protein product [Owenia fusiformis]
MSLPSFKQLLELLCSIRGHLNATMLQYSKSHMQCFTLEVTPHHIHSLLSTWATSNQDQQLRADLDKLHGDVLLDVTAGYNMKDSGDVECQVLLAQLLTSWQPGSGNKRQIDKMEIYLGCVMVKWLVEFIQSAKPKLEILSDVINWIKVNSLSTSKLGNAVKSCFVGQPLDGTPCLAAKLLTVFSSADSGKQGTESTMNMRYKLKSNINDIFFGLMDHLQIHSSATQVDVIDRFSSKDYKDILKDVLPKVQAKCEPGDKHVIDVLSVFIAELWSNCHAPQHLKIIVKNYFKLLV